MLTRRRPLPSLVAVLALAGSFACSANMAPLGASNTVSVSLFPPAATVGTGQPVDFVATVTGLANPAVAWTVSPTSGGTIDTTGHYVAPQVPGTCQVVATPVADPTVSGRASVTVMPRVPVPAADCANAPLRATGTVHYTCDCAAGAAPGCVAGNDGNPGTSPASPRRTLGDAAERFNDMNAGDTVALCRGGAWSGGVGQLANPRCRATSDATTCDFRDYVPSWGSAASPRPRIDAGGQNAFTMWDGSRSYEGYRFWNLDIRHNSRVDGGPVTFIIMSSQNHIDVCNVNGQDGTVAFNTAYRPTYLTIRNSSFSGYGVMAAYLEVPNLVLDSNVFVNNGDQATDEGRLGWFHTIYQACNDQAAPCPGVRIVNNHIRTDADGAWGTGNPSSRCGGAMLILRGWLPGIVIENNEIVGHGAYGCEGISLSGSFAYTEVHDAVISRNRVFWLAPVSTTYLQVDACIDCLVTDNIVDAQGAGWGIQSPQEAHQDDPNFAVTTGTVVRNNTVRMHGGTGISVGKYTEGTDFIVENNAVWQTSGGTCFAANRPTAAGHPFNLTTAGNHCAIGTDPTLMWRDPANAAYALRDYRPVNPGPLVGTANQTYYSPLAIGSVAWSPSDQGVARVAPIDIGAYQR